MIADLQKWASFGQNERYLWGEYHLGNRPPTRVAVQRAPLRFRCNCINLARPCNHIIGLLIALTEYSLALDSPPAWVEADWVYSADLPNTHLLDRQQTENALISFSRWLHDMVRVGLAHLPAQPAAYWKNMADLLIDARAITLAQAVQSWQSRVQSAEHNWQHDLLDEISTTSLLLTAFKQLDQRKTAESNELWQALGWPPSPTPQGEFVRDDWLIWGREEFHFDQVRWYRSWVWGRETGRLLRLHQPQQGQSADPTLPIGTQLTATLHIPPALRQQEALLHQWETISYQTQAPTGESAIPTLWQRHQQRLTQMAWWQETPALLQQVGFDRSNGDHLLDREGHRLPVTCAEAWHWQILALLDEQSVIGGTWDGRFFRPISVWSGGQLLPLSNLKGIK